MKKILTFVEVAIAVIALIWAMSSLFGAFGGGVHYTNAKSYSADPSSVYFYPRCPECGHTSELLGANVSEGESGKTHHSCEKCWHTYVIEIER